MPSPYGSSLTVWTLAADTFPETPRLIAASGQPSFGTGWSNFGGSFRVAQFYKAAGRVYLAGLVASAGSQALMFTLPAGYRPAAIELFPTDNGGNHDSIAVNPDGTVVLGSVVAPATYVNLSGISFIPG